MEYIIHLADAPIDLAAIERHLLDLDPAIVMDHDAGTGALRCATSAMEAELLRAFADAGYRVAPDAAERLPSVCCGGCGG